MEAKIKKPKAKVLGQDGNVFNIISICSKALKKDGQKEQANQMTERVYSSGSYDEALQIMMEYCEFC
jgi:uncharacterized membrane protein